MSSKNIDIVIKALYKAGITNPYSIAGIMSIIAKESGFIPQSEKSYANTSNERIKSIFSETRILTNDKLTSLKKDPKAFFDFVYGGEYGNEAPGDGYKYRGRGFNQLTFKNNYKVYSDILKVDLVNNPDLLNDPQIAARVVAEYFKRQFQKYPALILDRYGAKNINDFKSNSTAVNAFYNANAGLGKDTSKTTTQGKTAALSKVDSIYNQTVKFLTDNGGEIAGGGLIITALLLFFLITNK